MPRKHESRIKAAIRRASLAAEDMLEPYQKYLDGGEQFLVIIAIKKSARRTSTRKRNEVR